jgi:hypothetical protein
VRTDRRHHLPVDGLLAGDVAGRAEDAFEESGRVLRASIYKSANRLGGRRQ